VKKIFLKKKKDVPEAEAAPEKPVGSCGPVPVFSADCSTFRGHKVLGEILKVHEISMYFIVEHHVPCRTSKFFHPFFEPNGTSQCVDLNCDFMDIDDALLVAIAHRRKMLNGG
jgi:hypothetical protein